MRVWYARMACCLGGLAGSFFHSLEESGHLGGMVLSVLFQWVGESGRWEPCQWGDCSSEWRFLPAEGLVCGVILPVGGRIGTFGGLQAG